MQSNVALTQSYSKILEQLRSVIIGQEEIIEQILIALFSQGHVLLVGVPGLAKTLLVSSLSQVLDLNFKRIQFTPDLMPFDITGTEILQEDSLTKERFYKFVQGPIFAHIVLADEINRASAKTQSALLQAMQENKVTSGTNTFNIESPFFVLATQNPIEQEGTYALPEAQLDRFMFQLELTYPTYEQEKKIVEQTTLPQNISLKKVIDAKEIIEFQQLVRKVPIADHVIDYALKIVRATRKETGSNLAQKWIAWGAGPRAAQALILGSKARCLLQGRTVPSVEDVKALALPVLRHRIVLSFFAESQGINSDQIIQEIISI